MPKTANINISCGVEEIKPWAFFREEPPHPIDSISLAAFDSSYPSDRSRAAEAYEVVQGDEKYISGSGLKYSYSYTLLTLTNLLAIDAKCFSYSDTARTRAYLLVIGTNYGTMGGSSKLCVELCHRNFRCLHVLNWDLVTAAAVLHDLVLNSSRTRAESLSGTDAEWRSERSVVACR
ncbi:hypothetical protein MUK42_28126 [Musa troglodytarum]|uniref:Uncharacterized protein n=1 Tax=Musa troglodytarum TaxID=320322 RepID=A0A9E7F6U6_9LILI|nr:hypothetical protein MUK42_28126 [Musa troglodytarum]